MHSKANLNIGHDRRNAVAVTAGNKAVLDGGSSGSREGREGAEGEGGEDSERLGEEHFGKECGG